MSAVFNVLYDHLCLFFILNAIHSVHQKGHIKMCWLQLFRSSFGDET